MKSIKSIALLLAVVAFTANVQAEEAVKECAKECAKQCASACSKSCDSCPVSKAMELLPKMVYQIGEEKTECPKAAAKLAGEKEMKVKFVVGEKEFPYESDAYTHLVSATEKFVTDFAKPHTCSESGKTFVASREFCCEVEAGKVTKLVSAAMDDVKMTYMVGKEKLCCPDAAKTLAKETGDEIVKFVGKEKLSGCCGSTSRITLARAKYKAAIQALVSAEKTEENPTSDS